MNEFDTLKEIRLNVCSNSSLIRPSCVVSRGLFHLLKQKNVYILNSEAIKNVFLPN